MCQAERWQRARAWVVRDDETRRRAGHRPSAAAAATAGCWGRRTSISKSGTVVCRHGRTAAAVHRETTHVGTEHDRCSRSSPATIQLTPPRCGMSARHTSLSQTRRRRRRRRRNRPEASTCDKVGVSRSTAAGANKPLQSTTSAALWPDRRLYFRKFKFINFINECHSF